MTNTISLHYVENAQNPQVLGGTYLTALVTEYLLMPLDWPHTLCMVFGGELG
jgi:hypothetical protein